MTKTPPCLCLTATGAWYTNRADYSTQGGSETFKLDSYFNLVITSSEQGGVAVTRTVPGQNDPQPVNKVASGDDQGKYLILPGDVITAQSAAEIHVTAAGAPRAFYYVYKITGNSAAANANWYADDGNGDAACTGSETAALLGDSTTEIDVTGLINNLTNATYLDAANNVYTVKTSLTTANIGESFTLTVGALELEVRTMQAQNISAADAYSFLTGNSWAVESGYNNTALAA